MVVAACATGLMSGAVEQMPELKGQAVTATKSQVGANRLQRVGGGRALRALLVHIGSQKAQAICVSRNSKQARACQLAREEASRDARAQRKCKDRQVDGAARSQQSTQMAQDLPRSQQCHVIAGGH